MPTTRFPYLFVLTALLAPLLIRGTVKTLCGKDLTAPAKAGADEKKSTPEQDSAKLEAKIHRLIEQLGSKQFASREKAQANLERMGLLAFDALHNAQNSDDIEIAMRARYLMRSMKVAWSREHDPSKVKEFLHHYGESNKIERKNRIDQLAGLGNEGLEALCRLARFETDNVLSKHAALLILNSMAPDKQSQRDQRAAAINSVIGGVSDRSAVQWLKAYSLMLKDVESSAGEWERLVQLEQKTFTNFPERTNRETLRDLYRWHASFLERLNKKEQSLAAIRNTFRLIDGSIRQLMETADWLIENKYFSLVDEIAQLHPNPFKQHPFLIYRLAEAQLKQDLPEKANQTAQLAFRLNKENHDASYRLGVLLKERGLFEWAEREFRNTTENSPPGSGYDVLAYRSLSEMFYDRDDLLAAAKNLRQLTDAMEKDGQFAQKVKQILSYSENHPNGLYSRMHYFYALHHAKQNDLAKQKEHLELGFQKNPMEEGKPMLDPDPDLLIGMYQLPNPGPKWREKTLQAINFTASYYTNRIEKLRQEFQANQKGAEQLPNYCNQYAWLIANTEGDIENAIRCSRESLKLKPNTASYLDTLGHCYYAKKDYVNAVKYQSQAVKLSPHSGLLQKQLKLFQSALSKSRNSS